MLSVAFNKLTNAARRLLPRNRFARSVSILAGGTAAGQAIIVAASPILTRLYSPEDFGVLAVFASLLAILGVIASLRYDLAIPLPETDEEAVNITLLSLAIVMLIALLTAAVFIPFGGFIAKAGNVHQLASYMWLFPVAVLLMGSYQVFNNWAIRKKAFQIIAQTNITQSLSMISVQMAGHAFGPLALIIGIILGHGAGVSRLGMLVAQEVKGAKVDVKVATIWGAAVRYRSFPMYSSWSGLLSTGGPQLPPLLFAVLYSPSSAGLYYLAHRVIAMPLSLLGGSLASVYMPDAVQARRENCLKTALESIHNKLSLVAMPPVITLFLIAPETFVFLFGEDWEQAGQIVRLLTPMLFFQFIVSPLSKTFTVMERQKLGLLFHVFLFSVRITAIALAPFLLLSFSEAIFWYSAASCVGYTAFLFGISSIVGSDFTLFLKDWLWSLLFGMALNSFLIVYLWASPNTPFLMAMCISMTALLLGLYYVKLSGES